MVRVCLGPSVAVPAFDVVSSAQPAEHERDMLGTERAETALARRGIPRPAKALIVAPGQSGSVSPTVRE